MKQNNNIDYISLINDYKEIMGEPIGIGSCRTVFNDIEDENIVIKIASNAIGIIQNRLEYKLSNSNKYYNTILPIVYSISEDGTILYSEKCRQCVEDDISNILKISLNDFCLITTVIYQNIYNNELILKLRSNNLRKIQQDKYFKALKSILVKYNLCEGDLQDLKNIGIVERDGKEQLVLIDYGLTVENYKQLEKLKENEYCR